MVHFLPPKSRAETPRRIPRPDYLSSFFGAAAARHGVHDLGLFAGTGVLDKMADVDDAVVAGVGVILDALELGASVGDSIAGEYTSVRHGTCLLWPRLREIRPSAEAYYVVNNRIIPCAY
jgi:hypothetical protein